MPTSALHDALEDSLLVALKYVFEAGNHLKRAYSVAAASH